MYYRLLKLEYFDTSLESYKETIASVLLVSQKILVILNNIQKMFVTFAVNLIWKRTQKPPKHNKHKQTNSKTKNKVCIRHCTGGDGSSVFLSLSLFPFPIPNWWYMIMN